MHVEPEGGAEPDGRWLPGAKGMQPMVARRPTMRTLRPEDDEPKKQAVAGRRDEMAQELPQLRDLHGNERDAGTGVGPAAALLGKAEPGRTGLLPESGRNGEKILPLSARTAAPAQDEMPARVGRGGNAAGVAEPGGARQQVRAMPVQPAAATRMPEQAAVATKAVPGPTTGGAAPIRPAAGGGTSQPAAGSGGAGTGTNTVVAQTAAGQRPGTAPAAVTAGAEQTSAQNEAGARVSAPETAEGRASADAALQAGEAPGQATALPAVPPKPVFATDRGSQLRRAQIENAGKVAVPDANGRPQVKHHADGSEVYQKAFTDTQFRTDGGGTRIRYRDDRGMLHDIPINDMRRTQGTDGRFSYQFVVRDRGGNVTDTVTLPEGRRPLFEVDPATGMRFDRVQHPRTGEVTKRVLGPDTQTRAQLGLPGSRAEAEQGVQKMLTQMEGLVAQREEKQKQRQAADERVAKAQEALKQLEASGMTYRMGPQGPEAVTLDSTGGEVVTPLDDPQMADHARRWLALRDQARREVADAEKAREPMALEARQLQGQIDKLGNELVANHQRLQNQTTLMEQAAADPAEPQRAKDARGLERDAPSLNHELARRVAGTPLEAVVRRAQTPAPTRRLQEAAEKVFGGGAGGGAPGRSVTLTEVLMQAPPMLLGNNPTPVEQGAAAGSTAMNALGILDPQNVHVTRGADGSYALSETAGGGGRPFARLDKAGNRIVLNKDGGPLDAHGQALIQNAGRGTVPIYLSDEHPPLSRNEVQDLIHQGVQAAGSSRDRAKVDAALTQLGLHPEGISQMVREGRLSYQDGLALNKSLNGDHPSYAARDAAEANVRAVKTLDQLYLDSDKTVPQKWTEPGNADRDHLVKATAEELGLSEGKVREMLEIRRLNDWTTPSGDKQVEDELTRVLPDGSILPNPKLWEAEGEFLEAIDAADASPEAKKNAKEMWGDYHALWVRGVMAKLETMEKIPGMETFQEWRQRKYQAETFKIGQQTEEQIAETYMNEQKNRNWLARLGDNVVSSFMGGAHALVASGVGALAAVTGLEPLSEYAAEKSRQAERSTQVLEHTGNRSIAARLISGAARTLPALGTMVVPNPWAAALVGASLGGGGTYADVYSHRTTELGEVHEQADKTAGLTAAGRAAVSLGLSRGLDKAFGSLNKVLGVPGAKMTRPLLDTPQTREALRGPLMAELKQMLQTAPRKSWEKLKGPIPEGEEWIKGLADNAAAHFITAAGKDAGSGKTVQQYWDDAMKDFEKKLPEMIGGILMSRAGAKIEDRARQPEGPPQPPPVPKKVQQAELDAAAARSKNLGRDIHHTKKLVPPAKQVESAQLYKRVSEETARRLEHEVKMGNDSAKVKKTLNTAKERIKRADETIQREQKKIDKAKASPAIRTTMPAAAARVTAEGSAAKPEPEESLREDEKRRPEKESAGKK